MGQIGFWEWVMIGLAIAIFFGASRLPKLGQGLGEGIRNFKKGLKGEPEGEVNALAKKEEEKGDEGKEGA